MSKFPISLKVQPSGSRNLFFYQSPCNLGSTCAVDSEIKDFLDNPACLNVNYKCVLDFGMSDISEGCIGMVCPLGEKNSVTFVRVLPQ